MSNTPIKLRSLALPIALIGVMAATSACTNDPGYYDSKARMRIEAEDASGNHRNNSYRDPNPRYEPNDDTKGDADDGYYRDGRYYNDGSYTNSSLSREDRIEQRIADLHDALNITPAQEAQWNMVANIMRDNELATYHLLRDHMANRGTRNAVEDFKSYERVASSHVNGLRELIPAFESLYDSMPADQQANADRVFDTYKGQWAKTMRDGHMKGKRNSGDPKTYKSAK